MVSEFTDNTKCNVSFTSSEEEIEILGAVLTEANLKIVSGIATTQARSLVFVPSVDMNQIIIGGR